MDLAPWLEANGHPLATDGSRLSAEAHEEQTVVRDRNDDPRLA
jgi:hypothetical protein